MNRERIKQLRDHLAGLKPAKFNLASWLSADAGDPRYRDALVPECGTTACIAGHALALFKPEVPFNFLTASREAREVLSLGPDQAGYLFVPKGIDQYEDDDPRRNLPNGRSRASITTAEAVKVLNHLLETGEVDWQVITLSQEVIP